MAHEIDYEIIGDDMQAAIITLDGNEMLQAEAGSMMFMTDGVQMNTGTGGGLLKGVKKNSIRQIIFYHNVSKHRFGPGTGCIWRTLSR